MSNTGTFIVPTCKRPDYNLLSPYDTDLKTEFEKVEKADFTNDTSTTCTAECNKDLKSLGYTQALYNCAICMGLNSTDINTVTKPQLASSWGCSSCYDVIAPIAYYKNTVSNTSTSPSTVTPDDITKYFTVPTYRTVVDTTWTNAGQLDKGFVVRRYCVESPTFTMTTPPQEEKSIPKNSSGIPVWEIVLIVLIVIIVLAFIIVLLYRWRVRYRHKLTLIPAYVNNEEIELQGVSKIRQKDISNFPELEYVGLKQLFKAINKPWRPLFCAYDTKNKKVACYSDNRHIIRDDKPISCKPPIIDAYMIQTGKFNKLSNYLNNLLNFIKTQTGDCESDLRNHQN